MRGTYRVKEPVQASSCFVLFHAKIARESALKANAFSVVSNLGKNRHQRVNLVYFDA